MRVSDRNELVFDEPEGIEPAEVPGDASLPEGRKQLFMSRPIVDARQLPVETFQRIAADYKTRHGIDIRFNGGEDNLLIEQAQREWIAARREVLTGPRAYVEVAVKAFNRMNANECLAYQAEMGDCLFGIPAGVVQREKAEDFIARIKASARWKSIFNQVVSESLAALPAEARRIGLDISATARSIIALIPEASRSPIGFLRPYGQFVFDGINQGYGHIASYIINGHYVLAPAENEDDLIIGELMTASVKFAKPNFSDMLLNPQVEVCAQSDLTSCGSLAVSQQKELLKNNAQQLHNDCLIISNSERQPPLRYPRPDFFLPSAQSLRYSQSTLFIKVARAFVAGDGPTAEVDHKGQTYRLRTLVGLQQEGADLTMVDGRQADLADFRRRWLDNMDQVATPKRDAMQSGPEEQDRNQYLAYVVYRHSRRIPAVPN